MKRASRHRRIIALATVALPVAKAVKIHARSNASSNAITVSACINEKTA